MKKKVNPKDVNRSQWDFSTCPKEQLSLCVAHEYLRQIALAHRERLGRKKWTPEAFSILFDGYFWEGKHVEFKGISEGGADPFEVNLAVKRLFAKAACHCSGFPDRPFLDLPPEERQRWVKSFNLDQYRPDRATMAQQPFFEIILDSTAALPAYQKHVLEWARQNLFNAQSRAASETRKLVNFDGFSFEIGVVRINWSQSNKSLAREFTKWLESNRPEDVKAFETRGSLQLTEALKYLSSMRLLSALTANEATNLTQKSLGEPLYWSEDNWYAASAKANDFMEQLSTPFFTWANPQKPCQ